MTALSAPVVPSRGALRPLAVDAVVLGGVLGERVGRSAERTLPHCVEHLESSGVMDNLRSLLDDEGRLRAPADIAPHRGYQFADSDLFKVLEAIGWERVRTGTTQWDDWLDGVLGLLRRVQEPDGYLSSWGQRRGHGEHLRDMVWSHEIYCAGHLIQAGIALNRSGNDGVLEVARREADLIVRELGPRSGARRIDGHPEVETALVELARETGDHSYLDTALHLLEVRGEGTLGGDRMGPYYFQDHLPVRTAPMATGHAVRQLYLNAGCVDAAVEADDPTLLAAVERRWEDVHARRAAVTRAMGSRHADESFGDAFELPPRTGPTARRAPRSPTFSSPGDSSSRPARAATPAPSRRSCTTCSLPRSVRTGRPSSTATLCSCAPTIATRRALQPTGCPGTPAHAAHPTSLAFTPPSRATRQRSMMRGFASSSSERPSSTSPLVAVSRSRATTRVTGGCA